MPAARLALASARLGKKTAVLTFSMDNVALLPCNPSIGGSGRPRWCGKLMHWAEKWAKTVTPPSCRGVCSIPERAGASLRVQLDRKPYQRRMKYVLETTPTSSLLKEGLVTKLLGNKAKLKG